MTVGALPSSSRLVEYLVVYRVSRRRRHRQVDTGHRTAEDERLADVVAVANPRRLHFLERADVFADGEQVGERLTRVGVVGQAVDDGCAGVFGDFEQVVVVEQAGHDGVAVATQHAGRIGERFAVAELDVFGAEKERVTAQLGHPRFEGDTRAGARLLEEHRQRRSGQSRLVVAGLDGGGAGENAV
ncbi:hypothetical protein BM92_09080 [Haloferax mediterranei ATCC 33500]|uniref:Uncharacterized protein n=1 Tax=Haloferax mediterranei (strain ATCC 33500 / DSM 1411 / JCM 8866 / NBRC 14739 / NCIMB 2177 / R-4) TaxID=523841 RepID=A0A059TMF3_HALMT|nr:hypothetical protein BM92_09080 [Haloferax mediterranei ATCC 33500]